MMRVLVLAAFVSMVTATFAGSGSPLEHPANARLAKIVAAYGLGHPEAPAPQARVSAPMQPAAAKLSASPAVAVQTATAWPNLCATTDNGGHVSSRGPRGNWRTTSHDAYVALPHFDLRERTVYIRCRCPKHLASGILIPLPVWDTGPWSRWDNFFRDHRRPMVENGVSDTYKHVPHRAPAIDLSPAAWAALGHNIGYGRAAGNYSGYVDLVLIETVVEKGRARAD